MNISATIRFTIFTFILVASHVFVCQAEDITENQTVTESYSYILQLGNVNYSGTYTGDTKNGLPNGTGSFVSDDSALYAFTYEGSFVSGLFEGAGTITYGDDLHLSGEFTQGLPTGEFTLSYPDHSYSIINYDGNGFPYGSISTYSSDSQLIDYDFYYDSTAISALKEDSQEIAYHDLFYDSDTYYGNIIKLSCTVQELYENADSCIFVVTDDNNHLYWGSYNNTAQLKYNQSILPLLSVGDKIELYAFFRGINSYTEADTNSGLLDRLHYSLPELTPITCTITGNSFDFVNISYDYEDILQFPFHYYEKNCVLQGEVAQLVYMDNISYIKLLAQDGNDYYCSFNQTEKDISLAPGDIVSITGKYNGLYKEYNKNTNDYSSYFVLIAVDKISS